MNRMRKVMFGYSLQESQCWNETSSLSCKGTDWYVCCVYHLLVPALWGTVVTACTIHLLFEAQWLLHVPSACSLRHSGYCLYPLPVISGTVVTACTIYLLWSLNFPHLATRCIYTLFTILRKKSVPPLRINLLFFVTKTQSVCHGQFLSLLFTWRSTITAATLQASRSTP
jgi:hypothetical protein